MNALHLVIMSASGKHSPYGMPAQKSSFAKSSMMTSERTGSEVQDSRGQGSWGSPCLSPYVAAQMCRKVDLPKRGGRRMTGICFMEPCRLNQGSKRSDRST